jgi:hypothetical protein
MSDRGFAIHTMPESQPSEGPHVRVLKVRAKRIREGDQIVVRVARVMGMQGRKPRDGAPLMRIELDDGTTLTLREDAQLPVLRQS